jgi:hypothetical protein
MTDQERQKKYRNFNWTECGPWQWYYSNLYPIPTTTQIERIKRKWYKQNIDKEFNIDAEPSFRGSQQ